MRWTLATLIDTRRDRKLVVLASGDALFFGIANFLLRHVAPGELTFHPNVTSVQTACARVGRPWSDLVTLSLHGRPLSRLRAAICDAVSLAIYTDSINTPVRVASELVELGYADSRITVFEALDSEAECISTHRAGELAEKATEFNPLNLLLVDVAGPGGLLPVFPGIPDATFGAEGDTQFTKREVRLAALSRLALGRGQVGWDIGAGSGGFAIEWARWHRAAEVFAVERDPVRCARFEANRARFGDHGNLTLIEGPAPSALTDLPAPDAVFVGGTGGDPDAVLDACVDALKPGGRLVAAGVTVETRASLTQRTWPGDTEFCEIVVSYSAPLGSQTTMRSRLPVLLATMVKA